MTEQMSTLKGRGRIPSRAYCTFDTFDTIFTSTHTLSKIVDTLSTTVDTLSTTVDTLSTTVDTLRMTGPRYFWSCTRPRDAWSDLVPDRGCSHDNVCSLTLSCWFPDHCRSIPVRTSKMHVSTMLPRLHEPTITFSMICQIVEIGTPTSALCDLGLRGLWVFYFGKDCSL